MQETKRVSLNQEERVARLFLGKRTPQSGGGKWKKGDVLSEDFLVECKTSVTPRTSYSVNRKILDKANEERREMNKPFYALAFTFGTEEDFFVVDTKTMKYLLSCVDACKNQLD